MSQGQQRRDQQEPIKYGDVLSVGGDLAEKPVAPRDAAMMQSMENAALGKTQKGAAAATMQSAAMRNERAGFVSHEDVNDAPAVKGVSITETHLPGKRVVTETVGGQVVDQYSQQVPPRSTMAPPSLYEQDANRGGGPITIGEALEAAAITAGHKPVEWSDAAAIQAAEVRATNNNTITAGGVAAAAQSAATRNERITQDESKTKLADVLADATAKLPSDKPASRRDAEGVMGAEMRNDPYLTTDAAGVASSIAAAARLNQNKLNR